MISIIKTTFVWAPCCTIAINEEAVILFWQFDPIDDVPDQPSRLAAPV
jgi:hypothetical protein